ncbi:MAG TPA: hypothetical protein VF331_25945 [Polyangiales bacterium]
MRLVTLLVCASVLCVAVGCGQSTDKPSTAGGAAGAAAGSSGSSNGADGGSATLGADGGVSVTVADGGAAAHGGGGTGGHGAGGASGVNPPVKVSPKIADLASQLAAAICGALLDCVGQSKLDSMLGGEDCKSRVTLDLSAGDLAHLQASIDAGKVNYDASKLGPCLDGIKQLGCKIQTDSFPTACEDAVGGTVAVAGVCAISDECQGDAFCQMDSCPSRCANLLEAGDTCAKDEECGDKLVCKGGKCLAPSYQGEACAGTTGKQCALGFSCWNGTDTLAGTCHSNAQTLVGAKGAACSPGSTLCQEGLSCVFDGLSAFHCMSKVPSGGSCFPGLPGQCPIDEYCDNGSAGGDPRVRGKCAKLPGDGAACVRDGVCAPSFVCVPENQNPVCRAIHNNGGSCAIGAACRSGICGTDWLCEAPSICH